MALTTVAFNKNKGSFHQQIGPKFEKETSEMLQFEQNYLWCWNLDTSGNRSEKFWKFWNMVLGKMEISWIDCARNEEVLHRVKEERNILHAIYEKKG